jgi:hypothetical protein
VSRAARAVWDFVVGDDPLIAAGVVIALGVTALLAAWWITPLAVPLLLLLAVDRERRR